MAFVVVFVATNEAMSPVPFAPNPMFTLSFVHVNVPNVGELTKAVAETITFTQ